MAAPRKSPAGESSPDGGRSPTGERVLIPDKDDPETGQVVRGVVLEDDEDDAKPGRGGDRSVPLPPDASPVRLYIRGGNGKYAYAGTFPTRPSHDEIRTRFPAGGKIKVEYHHKTGRGTRVHREYEEVHGLAATDPTLTGAATTDPWLGLQLPPTSAGAQAPQQPTSAGAGQASSQQPQPPQPPPAAPGEVFSRYAGALAPILAAATPLVTAYLQHQRTAAERAQQQSEAMADRMANAIKEAVGPIRLELAELRTGSKTGAAPDLKSQIQGLIELRDGVQDLLGPQEQKDRSFFDTLGEAFAAAFTAQRGALGPPGTAQQGPPPQASPQQQVAPPPGRAELEAKAAAYGYTYDQARQLLANDLGKPDATDAELLEHATSLLGPS